VCFLHSAQSYRGSFLLPINEEKTRPVVKTTDFLARQVLEFTHGVLI